MKPLTYLLIDFENVQPPAVDVALVRGDEYRLMVFRGPHQNTYDAAMAEAWQPLGQHVAFVRSSKAGKNALDFHISFVLGRLCAECAAARRPARFVVVSKDGGFDALFQYMSSSLGMSVDRAPSIPRALTLLDGLMHAVPAHIGEEQAPGSASAALSGEKQPTVAKEGTARKAAKKSAKKAATGPTKAAKPVTAASAFAKVVAHLRAHPANRPTTLTSLENHTPSMVGGTMSREAVKALVAKLVSDGIVTVTGKQIDYKIPKGGK